MRVSGLVSLLWGRAEGNRLQRRVRDGQCSQGGVEGCGGGRTQGAGVQYLASHSTIRREAGTPLGGWLLQVLKARGSSSSAVVHVRSAAH